ncbi:MBL fold metallo-hydrolase [Saccharopolyspora erythraea]|uniref:Metallo-beta-lactamase domain-containing protein n=1 Tax=Saccharopolyspora erythraea (strain ATCC 11635 / DSM 40517 / JCM 4748 / NBRC 13426 / NCIMB 8594 / NRRL 2338) TaxID=405948 RepID=A4FR25_SACEN|nr:hypothetical protein SACE_7344 [Saccharopolyspora erythraea NRRL 2338]
MGGEEGPDLLAQGAQQGGAHLHHAGVDGSEAAVDEPLFGGPTALFEYGGLRFLTDPTFDAPGDYPTPSGAVLTKTAPADGTPADLGRVDVVLLSHDEHADNLDHSGRALLADVPLTLTTPGGGRRLGERARGLADWESIELDRPDGGTLTVTGVPALHGPGPREEVEAITGEVVGFVLTAEDLPTVYVSSGGQARSAHPSSGASTGSGPAPGTSGWIFSPVSAASPGSRRTWSASMCGNGSSTAPSYSIHRTRSIPARKRHSAA